MKMRKYGLTGFLLIICIIVSQSVAIADTTINKITSSGGIITVSGSWDSGEALTYEVYKKDVTTIGFSDVAGFGEVPFSYDNKFNFTFGLKETGTYKIRISDGYEIIYNEFDYASEEDRGGFVDDISLILENPDTASGLINSELSNIDNRAIINTIGIDFDEYAGYNAKIKTAICDKIVELGMNKTLTEEIFVQIYNEAEAVAVINAGDEILGGKMVEKLNFSFENIKLESIKDSTKKEWLKGAVLRNAPYTSVDEIGKMYNKVSALYIINSAKISNIEDKLKSYSTILEITDAEEYKTYKRSADSKVNGKLVDDISECKPYTVKLLLEALASATKEEPSGGGGGSSSGGGGGGGSSSGGGSSVKNQFAIEEVEKTEEKIPETSIVLKFNDVHENHWAYSAISEMQSAGVISGVGNGMFQPDRTVTREEFVKMIVTAFKLEDETAQSHFHDVFESDWFYPYVSSAFEKGVVTGDNLGIFGVHSGITRQDAVLISIRAMKVAGKDVASVRNYVGFNDEMTISDYAKEAVKELYCAGKINGTDDGSFAPKRMCTRAEAAMMIYGISR